MTLFADASALVSMIAREPDALILADRLQAERLRLCSALGVWETMAALCRGYALSVDEARARIALFLKDLDIAFVPIGEAEYAIAADAYAQFGKGRHPAALNMGDCFSYACARTNQAKLLFKGDDFARTDIAAA